MSVKPISPEEANKLKVIPDCVITAVNSIISKKYSGGPRGFIITVSEVKSSLAAHKAFDDLATCGVVGSEILMPEWWFDFEPVYRANGWNVVYDCPAYFESYEAHYKFSRA